MPYDPNIPAPNAELTSALFRNQFQGLKALIDAIGSITSAQIDSVTTLPPGDPATASVSVIGDTLHFTFQIPAGEAGAAGPQGEQGAEGPPGAEGPQGPPFASAVVDGVNTVPPGSPAAVSVNFDGVDVRFSFDIPQGEAGAQGPAGEVTQSDLDYVINNNTSNLSNSVGTLGLFVSDPPTQNDVQTIADKVDELINALRR